MEKRTAGKGRYSRTLARAVIALVAVLATFITNESRAQWNEIELPRPDYFYNTIEKSWDQIGPMEWVDSVTAYVFEKNVVYYKTEDGGESWKLDSLDLVGYGVDGRYLYVGRCDFVTREFGIVSLTTSYIPYAHDPYVDSVICITTNAGHTWKVVELTPEGLWKAVGTNIVPLENGNILFFHGRMLFDGDNPPYDLVQEEVLSRSTDRGDSWSVYSSDTLIVNKDVAKTAEWLYVDSLHCYRFTWDGIGDFFTSYAKETTDGGRSWRFLKYPEVDDHPLSQSEIGGRWHANIHHVNDTGLVVVMGHAIHGYPGFGMVTTDVTKHGQKEGWLRVDADMRPFEEGVVDVSYIDGWHYYLTSRGKGRDSIWVNHVTGSNRKQGFTTPNYNAEYNEVARLFTPTKERVFLWTRFNGIWKFDWSVVSVESVESRAGSPTVERLVVYPNPYDGNGGTMLNVVLGDWRELDGVRLRLLNVLGETVFESRYEPHPARRTLKLNLQGVPEGIYFLLLQSSGTCRSARVVVY